MRLAVGGGGGAAKGGQWRNSGTPLVREKRGMNFERSGCWDAWGGAIRLGPRRCWDSDKPGSWLSDAACRRTVPAGYAMSQANRRAGVFVEKVAQQGFGEEIAEHRCFAAAPQNRGYAAAPQNRGYAGDPQNRGYAGDPQNRSF